MNKNEIFFTELKSLLAKNNSQPKEKRMSWQSVSSGEVIEAVRLPWYKVMRWTDEPDKEAERRLAYQVETGIPYGAWQKLATLFVARKLVSFVKPTRIKGQDELFILAYFGWWYVGIKTRVVNA